MKFIQKICNWYFTNHTLSYRFILFLDLSIVALTAMVCFVLTQSWEQLIQSRFQIAVTLALCLLVHGIFFRLFHTYRGIIRHSTIHDLRNVATAMGFAVLGIQLFHALQEAFDLDPFVVVPSFLENFTIFCISTAIIWIVRISIRSLYDTYRPARQNLRRVFIYGCRQGGISLANSIHGEDPARYSLEGFVSRDPKLHNTWLMGTRVFSPEHCNIVTEMKSLGVTLLFVSPRQVDYFREQTDLINDLIQAKIKIMMLPPAEVWDGKSQINSNQLQEVDIEDLLPRDKIEVDMKAIGEMLQGKRILITGAAGSIGSEMSRQVAKFHPSELILIDQAETPMHDVRLYMARNHGDQKVWTIVTSITNAERMEEIFSAHRPEYVFHAAAYKHVPMMEDNPSEAVQNNIYGTRVIADLAVKYGTLKFVMISTDKAVNPTNVMGCSKRICEIYCQSLNKAIQDGTLSDHPDFSNISNPQTQFVTTRFGNVLGSNGSVIPIFKNQIRKGGPVTVTHPDIIRFFMLIPEACRLVLEAGTMGRGGEIFVFDMGKPVRIVDLARRMIALSGAEGIEIKFTGLRPGEKLYEEVLSDAETTLPTNHPMIKIAKVREYSYEQALRNEQELMEIARGFDPLSVVRKMQEIVPEYHSENESYK